MPPERADRAVSLTERAVPFAERGGPGAEADVDRLGTHVHEAFLAERRADREGEAVGREAVAERIGQIIRRDAALLPPRVADELKARLVSEIAGLGPLDDLLADPKVSEVMVNGPDDVWVERDGVLARVPCRMPQAMIERCIDRVIGPLGLRLDRTSPAVDARLPDGSRVNAVIAPIAIDGPYLTIRRFALTAVPLCAFGPPVLVDLLAQAVRDRSSVVVSGSTGSGKTTLLNALGSEIDPHERVITIEDTAELRLGAAHVVRLESRAPTIEGLGAVTMRDLVRNALRMRPDRIVVGEVRGGEALDMVQAMSTGHRGSLSSVHANGPDDALRRLEVMLLMAGIELPLPALWRLLAGAIDLLVHVERTGSAARRVAAVARPVLDREGLHTVSVWMTPTDRNGAVTTCGRPGR